MSSEPFQCFVNGEWIEFDDFDADLTLAQALRDRLGLTGTKIACGVGSCGSCTVVVSKLNVITGTFQHYTVNACITPIYWLHGCHVLTVEGLGEGSKVDPIQNAIALGHGTQCGFCTPGMVMSMYGCRINNEKPNINEIKTALAGNLCRCTGYRPILDAFQKCIGNCKNCAEQCKETDIEDTKHEVKGCFDFPHVEGLRKIIPDKDKKIREVEQLLTEYHEETGGYKPKSFVGSNNTWLVPHSAEDLYIMIDKYPDAKLSGGYTSQAIQSMSIKSSSNIIDLTYLPELKPIELSETFLRLGAVLTISEMVHEIENAMKNLSDEKTKILHCFLKMAKMYGSTQIRNSATLGGSLMIQQSHSDFQTLCKCFGVNNNYLIVPEDSEWKGVILASVDIPLTNENDFVFYEKVSRRKDCDGAILNIAVRFKNEDIQEVFVTFGGSAVSLFSIHFLTTAEDTNSPFGGKLLDMMLNEVDEKVEANMKPDSPFEANYVKTLAKSLLKKFNNLLTEEMSCNVPLIKDDAIFNSTQLFSIPSDGIPSSNDLVHKPVPHASAFKHATGEARFCDDVPKFHHELEMAFVTSTRAHAKILRVSFKKALKLDKVFGYVWHKDLPKGKNLFGLVVKDEEIFASETVSCFGQIIAGILANDRLTAKIAASLVEVEYEDITPVILTNEDAIKHNSFYEDYALKLGHGDCEKVFSSCPNVLSGEVKVGGQEHFYMEPHGCIAIPTGEEQEMEIISATQNPMAVQKCRHRSGESGSCSCSRSPSRHRDRETSASYSNYRSKSRDQGRARRSSASSSNDRSRSRDRGHRTYASSSNDRSRSRDRGRRTSSSSNDRSSSRDRGLRTSASSSNDRSRSRDQGRARRSSASSSNDRSRSRDRDRRSSAPSSNERSRSRDRTYTSSSSGRNRRHSTSHSPRPPFPSVEAYSKSKYRSTTSDSHRGLFENLLSSQEDNFVQEVRPLYSFVNDKNSLLREAVKSLGGDGLQTIIPPELRHLNMDDLEDECLEVLEKLDVKTLLGIMKGKFTTGGSKPDAETNFKAQSISSYDGGSDKSSSKQDSDTDDEDTELIMKKKMKKSKKKKRKKKKWKTAQSDQEESEYEMETNKNGDFTIQPISPDNLPIFGNERDDELRKEASQILSKEGEGDLQIRLMELVERECHRKALKTLLMKNDIGQSEIIGSAETEVNDRSAPVSTCGEEPGVDSDEDDSVSHSSGGLEADKDAEIRSFKSENDGMSYSDSEVDKDGDVLRLYPEEDIFGLEPPE